MAQRSIMAFLKTPPKGGASPQTTSAGAASGLTNKKAAVKRSASSAAEEGENKKDNQGVNRKSTAFSPCKRAVIEGIAAAEPLSPEQVQRMNDNKLLVRSFADCISVAV